MEPSEAIPVCPFLHSSRFDQTPARFTAVGDASGVRELYLVKIVPLRVRGLKTDVHPWKWGNPLILKESLKNCSDYMGSPLFFKRLRYLIPYRSQCAIGTLLVSFQ